MAITKERQLDKEANAFAARFREYRGSMLIRLEELDSIFGGRSPLLHISMEAAGRNSPSPSFDSASRLLDSIKRVAAPVIETGDEKEKRTTYTFIHMLTMLNDVNHRVNLGSHIAETMYNISRSNELKAGDAAKILSSINKVLGSLLSTSSGEDAVKTAAAFESLSRIMKNPESLILVSEIIQNDKLAELQRREKEE
jgi:hypothetical protein